MLNCPLRYDDIEPWAAANQRSVDDAWLRYATYVVLLCVGDNAVLRELIVLQGSAAISLAYHGGRSSADVDFLMRNEPILKNHHPTQEQRQKLIASIGAALTAGEGKHYPANPMVIKKLHSLVKVDLFTPKLPFKECRLPLDNGLWVYTVDVTSVFIYKFDAISGQNRTSLKRAQDIYDMACLIEHYKGSIDMILFYNHTTKRQPSLNKHAGNVIDWLNTEWLAQAKPYYEQVRALTFNNFIDLDAAWDLLVGFMCECQQAVDKNRLEHKGGL